MDDDLVLIETGQVVDGLAGVARSAGQDQSLGAVERGGLADLAGLGGVSLRRVRFEPQVVAVIQVGSTYTLEGGLGSGVGLLGALGGSYIIIRISNRSYSELAKSAAA